MATLEIKPIKILIIGDSTVGKTCLLQRYIDDEFNASFITTIGIDFKTKRIMHKNLEKKVVVWDTAGQERFKTITRAYYRGSNGMLLVYDTTNRNSFNNINRWIREIKESASEDVEIVLIGNKFDLVETRQVSYDEGLALANSYGLDFFETSAKNNNDINNVNRSFEKLINNICDKIDFVEEKETYEKNPIELQTVKQESNCGCKN